jgi:hypothetical protein
LPSHISKGADFNRPYIYSNGFELVGGKMHWLIPT